MPHPRIAGRRPFAGLLLVLQVAVLGAWLPHASGEGPRSATAHVEAAGASDCPAVHDESSCGLCQTMTLRLIVPRAGSPRLPETPIARGCRPGAASRAEQGTLPARGSRAPPQMVV